MSSLHRFSATAGAGEAHLRIMETTDLHVHVLAYDYYADQPVETIGFSRTASLIETARTEAANSLLFDNGDTLQGNPMGDYVVAERVMRHGAPHPIVAAMNVLGYDAATVGNHDFNYGPAFMLQSFAWANFPLVLANAAVRLGPTPAEDRTICAPYVLLEREVTDGEGQSHPLKVGVIGFVPPQIVVWDRQHLAGRVRTRGIVETARALVPRMRAEGAEIVVALSHSGIGGAADDPGQENASLPLAAVAGIDVVLCGHSHQVFPGPAIPATNEVDPVRGALMGKPAVMAGFWGSHLGLVDLKVRREDGRWRIADFEVEARPVARGGSGHRTAETVPDHPKVRDAVEAIHAETLAHIRRPVGRSKVPLFSYFALVGHDPCIALVNEAQRAYVTARLAGSEDEALPVLSAAAPFRAGGRGGPGNYTDVPEGELTLRNVADLYVFPNEIRAVRVTGAELKDWLERAAAIFNRIRPGEPEQILLETEVQSYNFDVIDGISYRIDPSRPALFDASGRRVGDGDGRITALSHAGRPVTDNMRFIVATNSYRIASWGGFFAADATALVLEAADTNRDVVLRYIRERGVVDPHAPGSWGFAPLPGTSALFDSSPRAARFLPLRAGPGIVPAGAGTAGFARYRIRF